ncbi:helix-turn-helix domain-containing protein [Spirosoma areae]
MSIGISIRQQRDKRKMSQRLLADLVGVAQSTISHWESELSSPNGEEIKKLAEVFEISVADLFPGAVSTTGGQQRKNNSPTFVQQLHPADQFISYEELLAVQQDLIQMQKARILTLEEENERLKNQQRPN